jgi:predicted glycogen debranching enzyme
MLKESPSGVIDPVRRLEWPAGQGATPDDLLDREWLVTNGLGGYASGTLGGVPTRSYHGLLVAALPAPLGRVILLAGILGRLYLPGGEVVRFGATAADDGVHDWHDTAHLREFRLDDGLPVWVYEVGPYQIERRLWMPYRLNTTIIRYRLLRGPGPVRLEGAPLTHQRSYDSTVDAPLPGQPEMVVRGGRVDLLWPGGGPPLHLEARNPHASFRSAGQVVPEVHYRVERHRGYVSSGQLFIPGSFTVQLEQGVDAVLLATSEDPATLAALPPEEALRAENERRHRLVAVAQPAARTGMAAELVLAADQFLIYPASRALEAIRLRAEGDDARTVIAGYHWFTDWGRDTMISLEGLALTTGRHAEARWILCTFARHVRDGLIPNFFPDGQTEGVYHTADATLWFFHALDRYVYLTGDRDTLRHLLPTLCNLVEHHFKGTRFGIGVDPADGLLRQGAEGYQLTWMDAKVGDWVVTPRRGKAVEINALWYNALCLLRRWLTEEGEEVPAQLGGAPEHVRRSFNARFWNPETGCLFDVVDAEGGGDDPAIRPNQLFSISLPHPVLDRSHWQAVLGVAREKLLTPVGLRSLAPGHPDYKARYYGDLRARDAAYHQGTVWGWLIGPFVDAWLKVHPEDRSGARRFVEGFEPHLSAAGIGTISEIFDAESPYTPRGCVAQAWSVAEVLRCWVLTA